MSFAASLKASFWVAAVTAAVGIAALLQDVVLAAFFSTGPEVDAYQLAVLLPLLGINIFAGGTLQAVLVPALVRVRLSHPPAQVAEFVRAVGAGLTPILAAVSGAMALLFLALMPRLATGLSAEAIALAQTLFWIVLPMFFLGAGASLFVAVLNSMRMFVVAASIPALLPLTVIAGVLLMSRELGALAIAAGATLGAALQWLLGRNVRPVRELFAGASRTLVRGLSTLVPGYWSTVLTAALLGGILFTDIALAAGMEPGSVATFGYASRPILLGLAFATVVSGNVALPHFSHLAAIGNRKVLRRDFLAWVGLLLALAAPVSLLCAGWAEEISGLLYQRGAFGPQDTARVAAVFEPFVLQAPFYLVAMIGWRVANALRAPRAMLLIALACFSANLVAGVLLKDSYGLRGVALATTLAYLLWAILVSGFVLRATSLQNADLETRRTDPLAE